MKTKKLVVLATILLSIFGCTQLEQPNFENIGLANQVVERIGGEIFTGVILSTPTSGSESMVLLKERGRNNFTRAFVLQSKNGQIKAFNSFEGNLIKVEGGLVILRGDEIHYMGIESEESFSKLRELEEISRNLKSYALGFGLSSNKGEWNIEEDMFQNFTANEILAISSLGANKVKLNSNDKTMACECTSGGAGSTSCSIDEPLNGCSVTCGAGYYSCCLSSVTRCLCVQNGYEPPSIC